MIHSILGLGGGSRFVFLSRYVDGVFQEPELIHGECNTVQYGEWVKVDSIEIDDLVDQRPWVLRKPDAVILFHGTGRIGSPESSGDLVSAVVGAGGLLTEAQSISEPGQLLLNPTYGAGSGGMRGLQLNGGNAFLEPPALDALAGAPVGAGGGVGFPVDTLRYESVVCAFEPDLAVESCRLSQQFPGAGARVEARVKIENRGFAEVPSVVPL